VTLSAQLQSMLVPVSPLGDGTQQLPSAPPQTDQSVSWQGENEFFAQVFAREVSKSLSVAEASQRQLPLISTESTFAVEKAPTKSVDKAEFPLNQSNMPAVPGIQHVTGPDEAIDGVQDDVTVVIDHHDLPWTSHQAMQDESGDLVPPFSLSWSNVDPTIPVSSDIDVERMQGARMQGDPALPGPSFMQSKRDSAVSMPQGRVPTDIHLSAPSDVPGAGMVSPAKENPQTGAAMPIGATGSVDRGQVVQPPQEPTLLKRVAQDKIKVAMLTAPLQSMPYSQPGLHPADHVVLQSPRLEPNQSGMQTTGSIDAWLAPQQRGQLIQAVTVSAEEKDRKAGAEFTSLAPLQTGGPGRTDITVPSSESQRAELPRATVQQLVDASVRATERPVELILNPEDLGRVRISMSITDASVTLNLNAERLETLDLLRRHSEVLAQELRDLGYGKISFSFGHHGHGHGGHAENPATLRIAAEDPLVSAMDNATPRPLQTGLDIRL
jgi:hypothetical protein